MSLVACQGANALTLCSARPPEITSGSRCRSATPGVPAHRAPDRVRGPDRTIRITPGREIHCCAAPDTGSTRTRPAKWEPSGASNAPTSQVDPPATTGLPPCIAGSCVVETTVFVSGSMRANVRVSAARAKQLDVNRASGTVPATAQPVPAGTSIVATVVPTRVDPHHRGRVTRYREPEGVGATLGVRAQADGGAERTAHSVDVDHRALILPPDPQFLTDELRIDRVGHVDRELHGTGHRVQPVDLPALETRRPQAVVGEEQVRVTRSDRCRKVVDRAGRAVDAQDLAVARDPDGPAIGREADHSSGVRDVEGRCRFDRPPLWRDGDRW